MSTPTYQMPESVKDALLCAEYEIAETMAAHLSLFRRMGGSADAWQS